MSDFKRQVQRVASLLAHDVSKVDVIDRLIESGSSPTEAQQLYVAGKLYLKDIEEDEGLTKNPRASSIHRKSELTPKGRKIALEAVRGIMRRVPKRDVLHHLRTEFGLSQGEADDIFLAAKFAVDMNYGRVQR